MSARYATQPHALLEMDCFPEPLKPFPLSAQLVSMEGRLVPLSFHLLHAGKVKSSGVLQGPTLS